jgi:hypothetical protein
MKWRARWSHVVIALAVIAAAAIAVPAFGGPSLKKLVKKEVSKQIAKATGPQGPPGTPGTAGQTGPSSAITAYEDAEQELNDSGTLTIESVELQPGAYLILAKTFVRENEGADNYVDCTLQSQNTSDSGGSRLGKLGVASSAPEVEKLVLYAQLTDTITAPTTVTYACTKTSGFGGSYAAQTKITAVRLGQETHFTD